MERLFSIKGKAAALKGRRGYTFLEVIISMVILVSGILAIINFFPLSLKASSRAELLSKAALLAQQKAEEIRRDDDSSGALVEAIGKLSEETEPLVFACDRRMTYSFCGRSILDPVDDTGDPQDDWLVPRIIVRHSPEYRSAADILFELRFGQ